MDSCVNSAKLCQTNVIGSLYKEDITIYGVPTRALIDSGSQVCNVTPQLLPLLKISVIGVLSDCLAHNFPLNNQPVGAEGSVLGATTLVYLEVVVEVTGKSLKVPCYVIYSTKPVWKGDTKNVEYFIMLLKVDCFEGFSNRSNNDELVISSTSGCNCTNYKLNNTNYQLNNNLA